MWWGKGQTGLVGGVALATSLSRGTKKRGSPLKGSEDGWYLWGQCSYCGRLHVAEGITSGEWVIFIERKSCRRSEEQIRQCRAAASEVAWMSYEVRI